MANRQGCYDGSSTIKDDMMPAWNVQISKQQCKNSSLITEIDAIEAEAAAPRHRHQRLRHPNRSQLGGFERRG